uniref:Uncharacterized protein n=1 Tax=Mesocestoides corti TaxID=53468 RepID=A0A5K3F8A3_MESCO
MQIKSDHEKEPVAHFSGQGEIGVNARKRGHIHFTLGPHRLEGGTSTYTTGIAAWHLRCKRHIWLSSAHYLASQFRHCWRLIRSSNSRTRSGNCSEAFRLPNVRTPTVVNSVGDHLAYVRRVPEFDPLSPLNFPRAVTLVQ